MSITSVCDVADDLSEGVSHNIEEKSLSSVSELYLDLSLIIIFNNLVD